MGRENLNIDLITIAHHIGVISVIVGGAAAFIKWLTVSVEKTIARRIVDFESRIKSRREEMLNHTGKLEAWISSQQEDIDKALEYNIRITHGVMACLKGLREQGCNSSVEAEIAELDNFIVKQANKGHSRKA